jgi:primosomal protein N'
MKKNNQVDFNYYKYLQLKALDSVFNPNDLYLQRKICRWYSKEYNTPLKQVLVMAFDEVLTHYYENQFENIPHNDLIDMLVDDHLPDVSSEEDEDIEEWVEDLELEQAENLKKKEKRQSLNNPTVPVIKKQSSTSKNPLQPEDIVMKFDDKDFDDE